MKSSTKSSAENFEDADTRVHLAPEEADQPALKRRFMVKLVHSSEVCRCDERNVFGHILEGIVQEEREARVREDNGEVN